MSLETLRQEWAWPAEKPELPFDAHGWCHAEHEPGLAQVIGPDTRVIVELGAWLGQSTRLMLRLASNATIISVDHWRGSPEMHGMMGVDRRIPGSFEQFLANQWEHRARIIPIRNNTLDGLEQIAAHGILPDLIFFDSDHSTEHLGAELDLARRLFPSAVFHGDDWTLDTVRAAVIAVVKRTGQSIRITGHQAWTLVG